MTSVSQTFRHPARLCAPAVLTALALASVGYAKVQPDVVVLGEGGCSSCRIVSDSVAYVGDIQESTSPRNSIPPAMDSRGRLFAIEHERTGVLVYDPRGRLLRRLGRRGQGPGEFPMALMEVRVGAGDTIYVFDRLRGFVFAPDLEYKRTVRLPAPAAPDGIGLNAVLLDGTIVRAIRGDSIAVAVPNPAATDAADQIAAGKPLISGDAPRCTGCRRRLVAAGRERGRIWSSPGDKHWIEQYDGTGQLLARFERRAPWFAPWTAVDASQPDYLISVVTRARTMGFQEDHDGILWTYVFAEDLDAPVPRSFNLMAFSEDDAAQAAFFQRHFATYVEAINPRTRQVLATRKFKGYLGPVGPGFAAVLSRDVSAAVGITVLRMRLMR